MPYVNGKFVDKNTLAKPSTGASPSGDGNTLRNILLQLAIANPKKASQLSTIAGLAEPSQIDKERIMAKEKEQSSLNQAAKDIKILEDLYFKNNLAKGTIGGIGSEIGRILNPGGAYDRYKATIESMAPTFARRSGDVGNLSEKEQKAQKKLFPSARVTRKEAEDMFNTARAKYGLPPVDFSSVYAANSDQWEVIE